MSSGDRRPQSDQRYVINMARTAKTTRPDAVSLLKADHRKVERLFERYEKARTKAVKSRLAREICLELSIHTTIEEELFYPAIKATVEAELYDEAYVEHDGAKVLIAELLAGTPTDHFYDAKVTVLSEMIKHHVKEEEQRGGLFSQARDDDDVDLPKLGAVMAARKKELAATMKSAGIPTPATRSMKGAELKRAKPVI